MGIQLPMRRIGPPDWPIYLKKVAMGEVEIRRFGRWRLAIFTCGPIRTHTYLFFCPDSGAAVLVDAAPGSSRAVNDFVLSQPVTIGALLLTHGHWDHTAEAAKFQAQTMPVYGSFADWDRFLSPDISLSYAAQRCEVLPCEPDVALRGGENLRLMDLNWKVIETAGHTPGGLVYYLADCGLAFTGDSLFYETIGRSDFPYGNGSFLVRHLRERVLVLPDGTVCAPGHGQLTTIGHERQANPFLIADSEDSPLDRR